MEFVEVDNSTNNIYFIFLLNTRTINNYELKGVSTSSISLFAPTNKSIDYVSMLGEIRRINE